MMIRVIEEVFDVDDEHFHDFILSEEKEDIEHQLIILIKRILDFMEAGDSGNARKTQKNSEKPKMRI
jgi:hypothetical protein